MVTAPSVLVFAYLSDVCVSPGKASAWASDGTSPMHIYISLYKPRLSSGRQCVSPNQLSNQQVELKPFCPSRALQSDDGTLQIPRSAGAASSLLKKDEQKSDTWLSSKHKWMRMTLVCTCYVDRLIRGNGCTHIPKEIKNDKCLARS